MLTGYSSIIIHRKNSFQQVLQRVARAIFWNKNSCVYLTIWARYSTNNESNIYPGSPVISVDDSNQTKLKKIKHLHQIPKFKNSQGFFVFDLKPWTHLKTWDLLLCLIVRKLQEGLLLCTWKETNILVISTPNLNFNHFLSNTPLVNEFIYLFCARAMRNKQLMFWCKKKKIADSKSVLTTI